MRTGGCCWRAVAIATAFGFLSLRSASGFDCNENLVDDFAEVESGDAPDCDGNGIPDGCDVRAVNQGLAQGPAVIADPGVSAAASADVDGDGNTDIALAISNQVIFRVLWGNGDGTFAASTHATGSPLMSIAVGNIDGDGLLDVATGSPAGLSVSHQVAGRRFQRWVPPVEATSVRGALAIRDIDGDGDADIVFAAQFELLLFSNEGAGLSEPRSIPAGSGPIHLIAADLDGDGDADIATANSLPQDEDPVGSVSIYLNQGGGTFLAARNFAVGPGPASLESGDIDGDGFIDLVTSNSGSSDIAILFGRGNGTFAPAPRIAVPPRPFSAMLGDLDLDGDLDLVAGRSDFSFDAGTVSVYWNHGGRILRRGFDFASGAAFVTLGVQDLYGDASPEIFASETHHGQLRILEKALVSHHEDCDQNGIPDACDIRDRDCNQNGLVDACDLSAGRSQDCDGDGVPDECETDCNVNGTPDDCDIASGVSADCNGNSLPDECDVRSRNFGFDESMIAVGGLTPLLVRDFDADGKPDLAGIDGLNRVLVHWNEGNAALGPAKMGANVAEHSSIAAGDIDGDGDLDFLSGSPLFRSLKLVVQSRARAFSSGIDVPLSSAPTATAAADLDGDGRADAAAATSSMSILILPGRPDGTLGPERHGPSGVVPTFLTIADMDGDGIRDLVTILVSGAPAVFWNRGDASFEQHTEVSTAFFFQTLVVEDFERDGDIDMTAADAGNVLFFRQTEPRVFERRTQLRGLDLRGLTMADLNRDGLTDVAVAQSGFFETGIALFLQSKIGGFDAYGPIATQYSFLSIGSADFDGDGGTDLAASLIPCLVCPASPTNFLFRNLTVPATSRDLDEDGQPDECDATPFRRGDADGDGALDLADAVLVLRSLFQGDPAPGCTEAADANNNGAVNVTDPVLMLEFLFRGGQSPPAPGPPPGPCGLDPDPPGSAGDLGCALYESC